MEFQFFTLSKTYLLGLLTQYHYLCNTFNLPQIIPK